MLTKRLLLPLFVFIVIDQCSGRGVWQALKDFKNTIIIPNEIIDLRTKAPWPICAREGQVGNCRSKRDIDDSEAVDNSATTLLENRDNTTAIAENESTETDNEILENETSTENTTLSIDNIVKTIENITTLIENITQTNNISVETTSLSENQTELLDNLTIENETIELVDNFTTVENETIELFDNNTQTENETVNVTTTEENAGISKQNNTKSNEETDYNLTDEKAKVIIPDKRRKREIIEEYKENVTSDENISNVERNSNITENSTSENDSILNSTLEINENENNITFIELNDLYENETSQNLMESYVSSGEYKTMNETELKNNYNTSINNETESQQNYNISIIYDENNTTVYPFNFTDGNVTLEEIQEFIDSLNDTNMFNDLITEETTKRKKREIAVSEKSSEINTLISTTKFYNDSKELNEFSENTTISSSSSLETNSTSNESIENLNVTSSESNENCLNFTNSFNESRLNGSDFNNVLDYTETEELVDIDEPLNFTTVLNETEANSTTYNEFGFNSAENITALNDTMAEELNKREKREIVMNLIPPDFGTKVSNLTSNEAIKDNLTSNKTLSADNITFIKVDATNGSISMNETTQSSAALNANIAAATEKVCLIQGEVCTNSSQCCENFECTMFDIIKWSSNCDFKPADPLIPTPLADIRIPKKFVPQPSL